MFMCCVQGIELDSSSHGGHPGHTADYVAAMLDIFVKVVAALPAKAEPANRPHTGHDQHVDASRCAAAAAASQDLQHTQAPHNAQPSHLPAGTRGSQQTHQPSTTEAAVPELPGQPSGQQAAAAYHATGLPRAGADAAGATMSVTEDRMQSLAAAVVLRAAASVVHTAIPVLHFLLPGQIACNAVHTSGEAFAKALDGAAISAAGGPCTATLTHADTAASSRASPVAKAVVDEQALPQQPAAAATGSIDHPQHHSRVSVTAAETAMAAAALVLQTVMRDPVDAVTLPANSSQHASVPVSAAWRRYYDHELPNTSQVSQLRKRHAVTVCGCGATSRLLQLQYCCCNVL